MLTRFLAQFAERALSVRDGVHCFDLALVSARRAAAAGRDPFALSWFPIISERANDTFRLHQVAASRSSWRGLGWQTENRMSNIKCQARPVSDALQSLDLCHLKRANSFKRCGDFCFFLFFLVDFLWKGSRLLIKPISERRLKAEKKNLLRRKGKWTRWNGRFQSSFSNLEVSACREFFE